MSCAPHQSPTKNHPDKRKSGKVAPIHMRIAPRAPPIPTPPTLNPRSLNTQSSTRAPQLQPHGTVRNRFKRNIAPNIRKKWREQVKRNPHVTRLPASSRPSNSRPSHSENPNNENSNDLPPLARSSTCAGKALPRVWKTRGDLQYIRWRRCE